ncbi:MAG: 1-deoxy-D-xylulose-5-phosphate reductoisomerase [Clostridia bacterium]|nr:1-deoxy-D-xylulose-5-phosphate reductoisomerase [Clostridia bacterium]
MQDNIYPSSVAVLGATGSVGTQALDVAEKAGVPVSLMSAHKSVDSAENLVRRFAPSVFVMTDEGAAKALALCVKDTATRVLSGKEALLDAIKETEAPVVIHSILGEAGLMPAIAAVESGKQVGLANKETMVIAGDLVNAIAEKSGAAIIPVDSEHSAIFQCLACGRREEVRSILLTASGGPFFGYSKDALRRVDKAATLSHPTWKMGAKITVDSATLMNKGFEVIEAVRLFDVTPSQVKVVVHRESIIHSAVEYIDSAIIAQLGNPDMRLCVQYALTYPCRAAGVIKPLSLTEVGKLTFFEPDGEVFPLLPLAFRAIEAGGAVPALLNAVNEEAVAAFLSEKIRFYQISEVVEALVNAMPEAKAAKTLSERLALADEARIRAREYMASL